MEFSSRALEFQSWSDGRQAGSGGGVGRTLLSSLPAPSPPSHCLTPPPPSHTFPTHLPPCTHCLPPHTPTSPHTTTLHTASLTPSLPPLSHTPTTYHTPSIPRLYLPPSPHTHCLCTFLPHCTSHTSLHTHLFTHGMFVDICFLTTWYFGVVVVTYVCHDLESSDIFMPISSFHSSFYLPACHTPAWNLSLYLEQELEGAGGRLGSGRQAGRRRRRRLTWGGSGRETSKGKSSLSGEEGWGMGQFFSLLLWPCASQLSLVPLAAWHTLPLSFCGACNAPSSSLSFHRHFYTHHYMLWAETICIVVLNIILPPT